MSIFHVTGLRAEGLIDPLGIDVRNPELSWRPGTEQKAWRRTLGDVLRLVSPLM